MSIYYILVVVLALCGLSLRKQGDLEESLCIRQTTCINGIFILLVFVSHIGHLLLCPMGYEMTSCMDKLYLFIHNRIGQLVVAPFLFYSGFGIASQMTVRPDYRQLFFRSRFLPLYLNFLVALASYLIMTVVSDGVVFGRDIVKSFVFLHSFGNPTWFLFCTFSCYFIVYTTFSLFRRRSLIVMACTILVFCYIAVVSRYRPVWWYDTVLCFPAGVAMALYKSEFGMVVKRNALGYFFIFVFGFLLCYFYLSGIWFNLTSIMFMMVLVVFTMKIKVGNVLLEWAGRHVFPIYIYHLLIFILAITVLKGFLVHFIVILTFVLTLGIAYLYRFWEIQKSLFVRVRK